MAFRLGLSYERANSLHDTVTPVLQSLVAQGTESASFHVRQNSDTRVCLIRVDSQHTTLDTVRAGQVLPLRQGAAGRVILAFDGDDGESASICTAGFVLSLGERDPLCAGLACPVFGPDNALRGAVSLSGPRDRFTETAVGVMLPLLMQAAIAITRPLGGDIGRIGRTEHA